MAIIEPPSTGLTRPRQTQLNTNVIEFNDPLLLINKGDGDQPNDGDIGFVFDRGSSNNVAFIWDEDSDSFILGETSSTGAEDGNVIITALSDLQVNHLTTSAFALPTTSGSQGYVLTSNGAGMSYWAEPTAESQFRRVEVTTNYQVLEGDTFIGARHSLPITITLAAISTPGTILIVKDERGAAARYPITINANQSTIDGQQEIIIQLNYTSLKLVWTGVEWSII
jgi:hypothetical protein